MGEPPRRLIRLPVGRILFPDDVAGGVFDQPVAAAVVEKAVVIEFPFALIQNLDAANFIVMNVTVDERWRGAVCNKNAASVTQAYFAIFKSSLSV